MTNFEKQTWYNKNDTENKSKRIPISATHLNRIEDGIEGAYALINELETSINASIPTTAIYLTFVGNTNSDMVSAAFGKSNEDYIKGLGMALIMYSRYKGEKIEFTALSECNTLDDISNSFNAAAEILKSTAIVSLMNSNAYSKPYIDLWTLNSMLPEQYRKNTIKGIFQDVNVFGYMYDNYASFESTGILSSDAFTSVARECGTTMTGTYKNTEDSVIYNKKCFIVDISLTGTNSGGADSSIKFYVGYRPDGGNIATISETDVYQKTKSGIGKGKFASSIEIPDSGGVIVKRTGGCTAIIIPCEP